MKQSLIFSTDPATQRVIRRTSRVVRSPYRARDTRDDAVAATRVNGPAWWANQKKKKRGESLR